MKSHMDKRPSWMRIRKILALQIGMTLLLLVPTNMFAQTYKVLHYFTEMDGSIRPYGGLVLSGATLYGTTSGPFPPTSPDWGAVFKINTDGSGFTVLRKFAGADGSGPWQALVLSGTTLYGVTRYGGTQGYGTVFRINTNGSGFAVLKDFVDMHAGYEPSGRLVLSGSTLYGMTSSGGASGYGNVFKVNTDGSQFSTLRSFTGGSPDGSTPYGGLVLSGTTLYGTTIQGGTTNDYDYYGCGTVFRINTDGSGFSVLKRFPGGDDGEHPNANLVMSGATLYGITGFQFYGNESNYGTVFEVSSDGSDFNVLKRFTNLLSDGQGPEDLVLSGTTLYGATRWGGVSGWQGYGLLFRIETDGSDFTVLKQFTGPDGAGPNGGLVFSGTTLYGTTISGGISNNGVVFASGFPPTIASAPETQTAETGSSACLGVTVDAPEMARYQWLFNDTNLVNTATNDSLQLTNIQPSDAGAYRVVVTNVFGAVTSAPALLNVIVAVERRPVPGVLVTGQTASLLNVDSADSLSRAPNWTTLGSVSLTSTSHYYFDLTLPLPPQRYYRAWQTGTPGVMPSLDLHIVPAITLAGNIGDSVRVDYINQFGPIDAWVTLGTVTLTNTSQLYFDVSAWGQPQRLYRLVQVP